MKVVYSTKVRGATVETGLIDIDETRGNVWETVAFIHEADPFLTDRHYGSDASARTEHSRIVEMVLNRKNQLILRLA